MAAIFPLIGDSKASLCNRPKIVWRMNWFDTGAEGLVVLNFFLGYYSTTFQLWKLKKKIVIFHRYSLNLFYFDFKNCIVCSMPIWYKSKRFCQIRNIWQWKKQLAVTVRYLLYLNSFLGYFSVSILGQRRKQGFFFFVVSEFPF